MKARFLRSAGFVAVTTFLMLTAQSADSPRIGAYDFGYSVGGDSAARPIQVFDDGRSTFMQFRPGMPVPAIFTNRNGAPQLLVPTLEGPYVRLPEVHGTLLLQMGRAQAQVIHAGGTRTDAPQVSVNTPAGREPFVPGSPYPRGAQLVASLTPVPMTMNNAPAVVDDALQRNSYATPRKGDVVSWQAAASPAAAQKIERDIWFVAGSAQISPTARTALNTLARSAATASRVVVVGRDDETYKDGLDRARAQAMRDVLLRAGVSSERITVRMGSGFKQDGKLWASSVVVEGEVEQPLSNRSPDVVVQNLQNLVRMGVLRLEQAEALARQAGASMPSPAPAGQPQSVAPTAASRALAATSAARTWEIRKSDGNVQQMLTRWANEAGWTLVWRDAPVIQITGDRGLPVSDFLTAADVVVKGAQASGYPISATAYSNQTLVVATKK